MNKSWWLFAPSAVGEIQATLIEQNTQVLAADIAVVTEAIRQETDMLPATVALGPAAQDIISTLIEQNTDVLGSTLTQVITNTSLTWTSAYCLAFVKAQAGRPAIDLEMTDDDWYLLLSVAQEHWYQQIAAINADTLRGPPWKLVTEDEGVTYQFPDYVYNTVDMVMPIGPMEVYRDSRLRTPIVVGHELNPEAEFTFEGQIVTTQAGRREGGVLRSVNRTARTYADGPYARYIVPTRPITATREPILLPEAARILICWHALTLWAKKGGRRDPGPFMESEAIAWNGDPRMGTTGFAHRIGMTMVGASSGYGEADYWWRSSDLGGNSS